MKPHEIFAEELHSIGWRSPCDAQWEGLRGLFDTYFGEVTGLRQEVIASNERTVKAEGTYRSQEIALTSLRARVAALEEAEERMAWFEKRCAWYSGEIDALRVKHDGAVKERDILRARCAELEERDSVWRKKKEELENDLAKAMEETNKQESIAYRLGDELAEEKLQNIRLGEAHRDAGIADSILRRREGKGG